MREIKRTKTLNLVDTSIFIDLGDEVGPPESTVGLAKKVVRVFPHHLTEKPE